MFFFPFLLRFTNDSNGEHFLLSVTNGHSVQNNNPKILFFFSLFFTHIHWICQPFKDYNQLYYYGKWIFEKKESKKKNRRKLQWLLYFEPYKYRQGSVSSETITIIMMITGCWRGLSLPCSLIDWKKKTIITKCDGWQVT